MTEPCSICLENSFKYTCPACSAKTCSVECVKRHKLRSECTGSVDPTKFIPNRDLTANQSLVNRDYNYLLNFERTLELSKSDIKLAAKNVFKRGFGQAAGQKRQRTEITKDPRLEQVKKVFPNDPQTSTKRQNTLVVHLPPGMSRAMQNKSGYDKKASAFTWTIEWAPVDTNGNPLKSFISFRLKETLPLAEAVPLTVLENVLGGSVERSELVFYLDNCISGKGRKEVLALDAKQLLASALENKVVLEFPKIYVGVNSIMEQYVTTESNAYNINDPDLSSASGSSDESESSDSDSESASDESESGPEEASSRADTTQVINGDVDEADSTLASGKDEEEISTTGNNEVTLEETKKAAGHEQGSGLKEPEYMGAERNELNANKKC